MTAGSGKPHPMLAEWFAREPVVFYPAGEELADGPLAAAGWYVDPFCDPGCCWPDGPFPTEAEARAWSRALASAYLKGDDAACAALYDEALALYAAAVKAAREA